MRTDRSSPSERVASHERRGSHRAPSRFAAACLAAVLLAPGAPCQPQRSPFEGRVVDRESGRAVPHFWFEAVGPTGRSELLSTDLTGAFRSTVEFAQGEIQLELLDASDPRELEERAKEAQPWRQGPVLVPRDAHQTVSHSSAGGTTVAIDAGPTNRIGVPLPEGTQASDFMVVFQAGTDQVTGTMRRVFSSDPIVFSGGSIGDLIAPSASPLRDEGGLWARFFQVEDYMLGDEGPPWAIELRSLDGEWLGTASVDSIGSGQERTVHPIFQRCGQILGKVQDASGRPARDADLTLTPRVADGRNQPRRAASGNSGRFGLAWIPAGEYVLSGSNQNHLQGELEVTVRPGETGRPEITLRPPPGVVDVEVVLKTATGAPARVGSVSLESLGATSCERPASARSRSRISTIPGSSSQGSGSPTAS